MEPETNVDHDTNVDAENSDVSCEFFKNLINVHFIVIVLYFYFLTTKKYVVVTFCSQRLTTISCHRKYGINIMMQNEQSTNIKGAFSSS